MSNKNNIHQATKDISWLSKLHQKLLPQDPDIGYMPYVWLSYLMMFFLSYFFQTLTSEQTVISIACVLVFLILYFRIFWVAEKQAYFYIAGIWLIGFILAINDFFGAATFFVYSAAFCTQFKHPITGFKVLAILIILTIISGLLFQISPYIYLSGSFFALVIGASNIIMQEMTNKNKQIKASQEEIKKIATSAERERIARDLHDLIGHTFSVINIKSQLAKKLVSQDANKAIQEIKEIEKISRASLSQVREVVSDYRKRDLTTELSQARILLDSLEINVAENISPIDQLNLNPEKNTALAYIVRELTTNIMRHSQATECKINLDADEKHISLTIEDNGHAEETYQAGSGLKGISERAEQLGGNVEFKVHQGFTAYIKLPITDTI